MEVADRLDHVDLPAAEYTIAHARAISSRELSQRLAPPVVDRTPTVGSVWLMPMLVSEMRSNAHANAHACVQSEGRTRRRTEREMRTGDRT